MNWRHRETVRLQIKRHIDQERFPSQIVVACIIECSHGRFRISWLQRQPIRGSYGSEHIIESIRHAQGHRGPGYVSCIRELRLDYRFIDQCSRRLEIVGRAHARKSRILAMCLDYFAENNSFLVMNRHWPAGLRPHDRSKRAYSTNPSFPWMTHWWSWRDNTSSRGGSASRTRKLT
jgi:hypothetical protein